MRDRVAVITGASMGLGRALAEELSWRGWRLVVDARDGARLHAAVEALPLPRRVTAIAGDVADAAHRRALADAVAGLGRLDLLVNNASVLGPSPRPGLRDLPPDELARILAVDAVAPLALAQRLLPRLEAAGGRLVNVTSDAAVEAYAGWADTGRRRRPSTSSRRCWRWSTRVLRCTRSTPATWRPPSCRRRTPARTSRASQPPRRWCRP